MLTSAYALVLLTNRKRYVHKNTPL